MKKTKLFMMLALLVVGVSNVSAEKVWVDTQKTTWYDTELGLEFSTRYNRTGSSTEAAPNGGVAVRLYLDKTKQVTDTVAYTNGRIPNTTTTLTTITGRTSTNQVDSDGDGAGTTADYKCLGRLDYHQYGTNVAVGGVQPSTLYFYERKHTIKYSDRTSVNIPASVTDPDGNSHDVTAIQKWGMCYAKSAQNDLDYCNNNYASEGTQPTQSGKFAVHNNINSHRNEYLATITFTNDSKIESIGDYAFMSCDALTQIKIPWTVSYLGQGTFECCMNLTEVELLECPNTNDTENFGKTKIRTIEDFTFWFCRRLQNVYLADGITRIEGKSYGSPFQYMDALSYVRLPNTLTYIGPHFLCSCTGIQTLTIPASVTYIDGACFHGCESLTNVYVLGEPADLQGWDDESATFDANHTNCGSHVNNATFWVSAKQLNEYKNHAVWGQLDKPKNNYGNQILPIPEETITFKAGMWATVIFPKRISYTSDKIATTQAEIEAIFGEGTHIAKMTGAKHKDTDEATYQLTFTRLSEIPCGVPLMIKPGNEDVTFTMFGADDQADRNFMKDMSDEHRLNQPSSNDPAIVIMMGKYMKEDPLKQWDFVFSATKNGNSYKYTFRKLVDGHAYANPCKCWWRIMLHGSSSTGGQNSKLGFFDEDEFSSTTAINGIETEPRLEIEAIYDLNGRRIEVKQEELPAGLYIMNGKKVLKK